MRKKVAVLGATGMLGSAIFAGLKGKYNLVLTVRDLSKISLLEKAYGSTKSCQIVKFDAAGTSEDKHLESFIKRLEPVDYVINAIGLVIAPSNQNPRLAYFINGVFPHLLSQKFGPKLIHITTDCVFDGQTGFPYTETSTKNPTDIYGRSKMIGEPKESLVLRTSIIGRELETFSGLLEWFLHQKGKIVKGFANHFWNGVTTKQFARICDQIMSRPGLFPKAGIYHLFSDVVSKYDMLLCFREKYQIDCKIKKDPTTFINRSLATNFPFYRQLKIPSFKDMIAQI